MQKKQLAVIRWEQPRSHLIQTIKNAMSFSENKIDDTHLGWTNMQKLRDVQMCILQKKHTKTYPIMRKTVSETNIAPENRPSQKENSLPTIHFQVLC